MANYYMKVHYTVFSHHMSVLCYPESEEVLCDNNNFSIKLLSDTFTIKESLQLDSEQQQSIWALTRENLSSGVCEQQMGRPACTSAKPDQGICYSLIGKYYI